MIPIDNPAGYALQYGLSRKVFHEPPSSPLSLLPSKRKKEKQLHTVTMKYLIKDMKETDYRRYVHLLPMASHFQLLDGVN